MLIEHVLHVLRVAGEDFVSLGGDFDGAMTPPRDLAGADPLPTAGAVFARPRLHGGAGLEDPRRNFLRAFALQRDA